MKDLGNLGLKKSNFKYNKNTVKLENKNALREKENKTKYTLKFES